ncbi:MAG: hypothetical protein WA317_01480 [Mycobacterium sp.]|uniref:hypothetical protein n=1 Tax=Mycobacterium sp. TaxID=1785 RepID=UPI003CC62D0F
MAHLPADDPITALEFVTRITPSYKAAFHGDDASGAWDIEFPDVAHAASFAEVMLSENDFMTAALTSAQLRDPVTDLTVSCVLTVRLNPDWHCKS